MSSFLSFALFSLNSKTRYTNKVIETRRRLCLKLKNLTLSTNKSIIVLFFVGLLSELPGTSA